MIQFVFESDHFAAEPEIQKTDVNIDELFKSAFKIRMAVERGVKPQVLLFGRLLVIKISSLKIGIFEYDLGEQPSLELKSWLNLDQLLAEDDFRQGFFLGYTERQHVMQVTT